MQKMLIDPDSQTTYRLLPDGGLFVGRSYTRKKELSPFDTFPGFWAFLTTDAPPGAVSVRTRGRLIDLEGPSAALIPPFSLIHWMVHRPLEVRWQALVYRNSFPPGLPKEAALFPLPRNQWPYSLGEIGKILARQPDSVSIEKLETYNIYAVKLRRRIEQGFLDDKDIAEYESEFGISRDVLTRYFRACFGLPPIEYRNQLRLFHAMFSLLFDSPKVTQISSYSGFRNLKNFNKQFTRYWSLPPSQLRFTRPR